MMPLVSVSSCSDGRTVWCAWCKCPGPPVEPDEWGVAPTWQGAVAVALHWLKKHGYTKSRTDHGESAAWWRRMASDEVAAMFSRLPGSEHLAVLDLQWPCTRSQLTRAWRNKARAVHPDHGGSDTAFVQVRAAYENVAQFIGGTT